MYIHTTEETDAAAQLCKHFGRTQREKHGGVDRKTVQTRPVWHSRVGCGT